MKVIISGGGTGGHIYPAIAIADALKERVPGVDILFVGAKDRMEMQMVPKAGYPIEGIEVAGFNRKNILKNIKVVFKLLKGLSKAKSILKNFKPDIAVGVGGYASAPVLKEASKMGIPTLVQEQNSYAGLTNKLLGKNASKICVAYDGMEKYFPADKIVKTGNPCRHNLLNNNATKKEALQFFNFDDNKKTLLILGGSLGARTMNQAVYNDLDSIISNDIQVIWQCGKNYLFEISIEMRHKIENSKVNVEVFDFIDRMDLAFLAADLVISRAGAGTISELSILAKPAILVPSPNVAEDHQTKNAMALVKHDAAILVKDSEAMKELIPTALEVLNDENRIKTLSNNIANIAEYDSANRIVDEILKIVKN